MEDKYTRRDFLGLLGKWALTLTCFMAGVPLVEGRENPSEKIVANNKEYILQNGVLSQASKGDGRIKLGLMADLHAHKKNSQYFANQLDKKDVEIYLLLGDLSHSFGDYQGAKDDFDEIISVVEPVAKTGKIVLTIPGNHEQRPKYSRALEHLTLKYKNVVDMQKTPVAQLDDLTIIALGGNNDPRFNVPNGYLLKKQDFEKTLELCKNYKNDKPLLIASHIPKKYSTQNGLDVIHNGMNVGSDYLAKVRSLIDSNFAVSGHIHEAQGIITPNEKSIKQGELSDKLDFNPGPIYDHLEREIKSSAGILEFIENQARAYIVNK
jgi:Icc-related predicted phosphoesterase